MTHLIYQAWLKNGFEALSQYSASFYYNKTLLLCDKGLFLFVDGTISPPLVPTNFPVEPSCSPSIEISSISPPSSHLPWVSAKYKWRIESGCHKIWQILKGFEKKKIFKKLDKSWFGKLDLERLREIEDFF